MNLKEKLQNLKGIIKESIFEIDLVWKYSSNIDSIDDIDSKKIKLKNRISVNVHGIEKGLSFRNPKIAFGRAKKHELLDRLLLYFEKYNDKEFVCESLSVLKTYIDLYSDCAIDDIITKYNSLCNVIKKNDIQSAPALIHVNKEEVQKAITGFDYVEFLRSRHSYRYFSKEPVDDLLLKQAFKIAELTPTACNRQPQNVYVIKGDKKDKILSIQNGCIGFIDEIDVVLLITNDMRAYGASEKHQGYIDGGLYCMNLLNALHYSGLGTIPLTMSSFSGLRRKLLSDIISMNESPILIIGVGNMEVESVVNTSPRKDYNKYVNWI